MKLGEIYPSKYLKAADIPAGQMVGVTIDRVELEDIGDDASKPVLYFVGKQKGLVLNKTNAEAIGAVHGDDTDEWHGHSIKLFQTTVSFSGKTTPCIRVAAAAAKRPGVGFPAKESRPAPAPPPQNPIGEAQEFQAEDIPF